MHYDKNDNWITSDPSGEDRASEGADLLNMYHLKNIDQM